MYKAVKVTNSFGRYLVENEVCRNALQPMYSSLSLVASFQLLRSATVEKRENQTFQLSFELPVNAGSFTFLLREVLSCESSVFAALFVF